MTRKVKQNLLLNNSLNDNENMAVQNRSNYVEKVDCFVNLIIVMLSNQSPNPVLLAFCTSLEKTSLHLLRLPTSGID